MTKAVLGLGANLGDRELNIATAIDMIEELPKTNVLRLSSIYETEPFDVISMQDDYLNCCIEIETEFEPYELLSQLQNIENMLHRVRTEYHGARTIDIDILLYEGFSSNDEVLTVPHKGIRDRAFVMIPLSDIYRDCNAFGFDFSDAFKEVDKSGISLYK